MGFIILNVIPLYWGIEQGSEVTVYICCCGIIYCKFHSELFSKRLTLLRCHDGIMTLAYNPGKAEAWLYTCHAQGMFRQQVQVRQAA